MNKLRRGVKIFAFFFLFLGAILYICAFLISSYYCDRGRLYYDKADFRQAISDYTRALRINPRYAEAYHNRGMAYFYLGNFQQAISDYNRALRINPKYAQAYGNRGIAYYNKGDYHKAWEDVLKGQELGMRIPPDFLRELRSALGK